MHSDGVDFDLELAAHTVQSQYNFPRTPLYAFRSVNGYGQERGSIRTTLSNPSLEDSIQLVYLESLPWFMRPFIHTLRASISSENETYLESPIQETYYRPAVDRHRGTQLELLLGIPPASTVTLTYDFEKAILRYTEYPPDANRGFDVAPAVVRLLPRTQPGAPPALHGAGKGTYLRTTSLLLPLPTPDFSMPYNVIILTSTVMALAFGGIFNFLVRRFVAVDEVDDWRERMQLLKGRLVGRFRFLKDKFGKKEDKKE